MKTEVLFSSRDDRWDTPQEFYDALDKEFGFTLDPCADEFNHKCEKYFTKEDDGLSQDWGGEVVFCNPPYGRSVSLWVEKAFNEVYVGDCLCCVMLIPARTDTQYFHRFIYHKAEVRFVKGRIKFGASTNNAPFPSMIVIYKK